MKRFFLLIYLTMFPFINGEILETKNFNEITNYIKPGTLVILDIDDTLLVPVQTLGIDPWFLSRLNEHFQIHNDRELALDRALAEWEAVRHLTKVKIVEEGTQNIIDQMQKNHVVIMGLTTQGLSLSSRTVMQLKSLSIDLAKTAPSCEKIYFINGREGVLYHEGILFTAGTSKGDALLKFLDAIKHIPSSIVFINDKETHLRDVEKSVEQRKMKFTGLRYSFSDERVANYNREIAEVQWTQSTFNHILSDEEALEILRTKRR